jgi:hypothetical protein
MWGFVTLASPAHPEGAGDAARAARGVAVAPLAGLFSVWLCKFVGRLSTEQLLAGVSVVGAVAMMLDGAAIRWSPSLYGASDRALMLSAGGLLWGYGVAFAVAVAWVAWARRRPAS